MYTVADILPIESGEHKEELRRQTPIPFLASSHCYGSSIAYPCKLNRKHGVITLTTKTLPCHFSCSLAFVSSSSQAHGIQTLERNENDDEYDLLTM